MKKREFSIVIQKDEERKLRKVKGYFTYLNDTRVFIYHDIIYRSWYVIDIETGFAFASGITMSEAKVNGIDKMQSFKKYQERSDYNSLRIKYRSMIKEELYEK